MGWQEVDAFLRKQALQLNSPYNDGFTTWQIKKDLYSTQELLDDILKNAPTYADEEQWLADRKMKKAFDKMGNR